MEILSPTCIIDADCSLVAFDEGSRVRAPDPKNVRFLVVTSQHPRWGETSRPKTWICLATMLGKSCKHILPNGGANGDESHGTK